MKELTYDAVANLQRAIPPKLIRRSEFLTHPIFNSYHSETEMMRYMRRLADKDVVLDRAMIPLGSCTMKLNATSEMMPVSWASFSDIHPLCACRSGRRLYRRDDRRPLRMLAEITGYAAISMQPNSGSQGELPVFFNRRLSPCRGEAHRTICLIPMSAHGTNPASAAMVRDDGRGGEMRR